MASEQIAMSDVLRQFLHARLDAEMEDAELAYRFVTARVDPADPEAHNWFDLKLIDGNARISYTTMTALNKAKRATMGAYPFAAGGWRTVARPSSVARRVAAVDDDGKWGRALDVFANAALATLKDDPDVTIVRGKEIVRRYNERTHCRCARLGDLSSSCMRYDGYEDRLEIYADVAQMAVIVCPVCQGTRARALLWTNNEGRQYIDRVYGSPASQEFLYEWAKRGKITRIYPNTNHRRKPVQVYVSRTDYRAAPYLDSLMFWCRTCKVLSNYECAESMHDKVLLRSTQAQGHTGWWGRCDECHHPFHDRNRVCPNRHACGGCGRTHCTPDCPNGCWSCGGCGVWMKKGQVTCTNACVLCSQCGYANTQAALLAEHGHCRSCSLRLQEEKVTEVPLRWASLHHRWEGRCPTCEYVVRISTGEEPRGTTSLIECRYIHDGYRSNASAHCPGCHNVMRWIVEPRPKDGPSTGGFQKTVHQPTMWKREGRGYSVLDIKEDEEREAYYRYVFDMWQSARNEGGEQ
jgi:hypothetical protein